MGRCAVAPRSVAARTPHHTTTPTRVVECAASIDRSLLQCVECASLQLQLQLLPAPTWFHMSTKAGCYHCCGVSVGVCLPVVACMSACMFVACPPVSLPPPRPSKRSVTVSKRVRSSAFRRVVSLCCLSPRCRVAVLCRPSQGSLRPQWCPPPPLVLQQQRTPVRRRGVRARQCRTPVRVGGNAQAHKQRARETAQRRPKQAKTQDQNSRPKAGPSLQTNRQASTPTSTRTPHQRDAKKSTTKKALLSLPQLTHPHKAPFCSSTMCQPAPHHTRVHHTTPSFVRPRSTTIHHLQHHHCCCCNCNCTTATPLPVTSATSHCFTATPLPVTSATSQPCPAHNCHTVQSFRPAQPRTSSVSPCLQTAVCPTLTTPHSLHATARPAAQSPCRLGSERPRVVPLLQEGTLSVACRMQGRQPKVY